MSSCPSRPAPRPSGCSGSRAGPASMSKSGAFSFGSQSRDYTISFGYTLCEPLLKLFPFISNTSAWSLWVGYRKLEESLEDYACKALGVAASSPDAKELLAYRGYEPTGFRKALLEKGIAPCILLQTKSKKVVIHDQELYKQHHKDKVCRVELKTGEEVLCVMADALTFFFGLSALRQWSFFTSMNEF